MGLLGLSDGSGWVCGSGVPIGFGGSDGSCGSWGYCGSGHQTLVGLVGLMSLLCLECLVSLVCQSWLLLGVLWQSFLSKSISIWNNFFDD